LISGNFKEKKGIEYAIKALGILNKENSDLKLLITIIGDGVLKSHLHNCAQECGIDDLIEWTGYQPHEEFIRRLYENDIFCSPSVIAKDGDTEGGAPVSIIEAGASGLPTVSTFHADIPDVIVNGKTGLLVPEKDCKECAIALSILNNDPELRKKIGFSAKKYISDNYNAAIQGNELATVINRIVSQQ
jgi:colanic acid/amylovoran biosynthesis glycosyltransferase